MERLMFGMILVCTPTLIVGCYDLINTIKNKLRTNNIHG